MPVAATDGATETHWKLDLTKVVAKPVMVGAIDQFRKTMERALASRHARPRAI